MAAAADRRARPGGRWMSDITLVEVGPRDGLQNEAVVFDTDTKVEFINRCLAAGARRIEVASFVNPKRVPQMADAEAVLDRLAPGAASYIGLVLNERGFDRALATQVGEVNLVVMVTDTFSRKNQGMTTAEAVAAVAAIAPRARGDRPRARRLTRPAAVPTGTAARRTPPTAWFHRRDARHSTTGCATHRGRLNRSPSGPMNRQSGGRAPSPAALSRKGAGLPPLRPEFRLPQPAAHPDACRLIPLLYARLATEACRDWQGEDGGGKAA